MHHLLIITFAFGLTAATACSGDAPSASSNSPADASDAQETRDATDATPDTNRDASEDVTDVADVSDDANSDARDTADAPDGDVTPDLVLGTDERPTRAKLPSDYDPARQYHLVIALHGYGMSGDSIDNYFDLSELRDQHDLIVLAPDGTRDSTAQRFWNATDYCCDHYGSRVDDAAYLMTLIEQAEDRFSLAPESTYLVGFSNGGFMAHRMACDYPDTITGIASLSGSSFDDADDCDARDGGPRILHIHGTADTVVGYYGAVGYPGARSVADRWAQRNGCDSDASDLGRADYDSNVVGDEAWLREWEGCGAESRVGLWSLQGSLHYPTLRDAFTPAMLDFLID